MEINRLNYEVYLLDYYEGNLSVEMVAELMLFLEQHLDLKMEFEEFENVKLESSSYIIDKKNLKREIHPIGELDENSYDDIFISEIEGNTEVTAEINEFVALNLFLIKERELYKKTILEVDETIVYPNKETLKRTRIISLTRNQITAIISIAAMIVFGLFLFNSREDVYSPRMKNIRASVSIPSYIQSKTSVNSDYVERRKTENVLINKPANGLPATSKVDQLSDFNEEKVEVSNQRTVTEEDADKQFAEIVILNDLENSRKVETIIAHPKENAHLSSVEYVNQSIRKRILKRDKKEQDNGRITRYELAEIGINSINKIFRTKIKIHTTVSDNGDLMAFEISSDKFEIERIVKK